MNSRDFCQWLKGFLDLTDQKEITKEQVECIKRHLALVFKYEIDPSYGDEQLQKELQNIHDGMIPVDPNVVYKC